MGKRKLLKPTTKIMKGEQEAGKEIRMNGTKILVDKCILIKPTHMMVTKKKRPKLRTKVSFRLLTGLRKRWINPYTQLTEVKRRISI